MPDTLEFPRVLRAVVPLMGAWHAGVGEFVAHRIPGLAAVVGSLDFLTEPAAGLRGWVSGFRIATANTISSMRQSPSPRRHAAESGDGCRAGRMRAAIIG